MQQIKIVWLQCGDTNSKKNYAKMDTRKHKSNIHVLMDVDGNYIYDQKQITAQAIDFHSDLFNGQTGMLFLLFNPKFL